jgi:2-dehydropantoate 2-reductase
MRHVLVGAGAVGIAYGWFLAQGGEEVAYRVKDKHAEALRRGTNVYFPKKRGVRAPVRFEGYEILTSDAEVASCDVAWLCVSATALRGPWLEPFLASLGSHATLVLLTPGAEDRAYLAARFPAERIVTGVITLVAWQTPLPGESEHPPGIAIWFPPMSKLPFQGPEPRVRAIVTALNSGPTKVAKNAGEAAADGGPLAGGILTAHVAALEGAGWTFAGLRKSPLKKLAAKASREAMAVLAAHQGKRPPFMRTLVRPWTILPALRVARWRMPFDFEVYLRYHFTKVRDQTDFSLSELVRLGGERGLPIGAIAELRERVFGAGRGTS